MVGIFKSIRGHQYLRNIYLGKVKNIVKNINAAFIIKDCKCVIILLRKTIFLLW